MTSLNALTLTCGQWEIVDRYISNAAQRFEAEWEAAPASSTIEIACATAARLARDYLSLVRNAAHGVASDDDLVTIDHAGVELLRNLSDYIAQRDDLTTWEELRTQGRHYRAEGGRAEYTGPAPDAEALAALLVEENARRASWRKIALPIVRAIESNARAARRAI